MIKKVSPIDLTDSFEKVPVKIYPDLSKGSIAVAREIADLIREKQKKKSTCVLGLATGSTPKTLYAELVRIHKEEKLSFKNVITFNLDEYYPIDNDALQSYNRFMRSHLFDHAALFPGPTFDAGLRVAFFHLRADQSFAANFESMYQLPLHFFRRQTGFVAPVGIHFSMNQETAFSHPALLLSGLHNPGIAAAVDLSRTGAEFHPAPGYS